MRSPLALPLCLLALAPAARGEGPLEAEPARTASPAEAAPGAQNAVYLEVGGAALSFSVNYERRLGNRVSLRAGAGSDGTLAAVPVTLSVFVVRSGDHALELGVGATYLRRASPAVETYTIGTGILGYRYAPTKGGVNVRVALTPLVGEEDPRTTYPGSGPTHHAGELWKELYVGAALGYGF